MYQKIKACLVEPRRIADYVNDKWYKHFIYLLILTVLVSVLPLITVLNKSVVDDNTVNEISKSVLDENIHFEIVDGKMCTLGGTYEVQATSIYGSMLTFLNFVEFPIIVLFDQGDLNPNPFNYVSENEGLVIRFTESNIQIYAANGAPSISGEGLEKLAVYEHQNLWTFTYDELGVKNFNFSTSSLLSTQNFFKGILEGYASKVIKNNIVLIVLGIILLTSGSFIIDLLFIALLLKLCFLRFKVKYNKLFILTLLSSTPYVVGTIIASLTGMNFILLLGEILMIVYAMRSLAFYKIKYDLDLIKDIDEFLKKNNLDDKGDK